MTRKSRGRRKKMLATRRAREDELHLFLEHSPAAIAMLDREMRYLAASRRWLSDYRLAEQDITGRSHYELFPDIPERWKEIHRRCLAGGVEHCDQDRFERADGTVDWVRWEIRPWRTESGRIDGLIIFSEVVTERVRAQHALREESARVDLMVRAANIGLWDWDLASGRIYFSPEYKRQIGYQDDELPNEFSAWQQRVHPDDLAPTLARVRAYLEQPGPDYRNEFRFRHKDGSYRWILATASVLAGPDGKPARMVGSHIDITESKRLEAERLEILARISGAQRQQRQELMESRQRFMGIVESAMDAIVSVDGDQRIVLFNAAAERMFGHAAAAVLGQPLAALIPEPLRAAHADHVRGFGATGGTARSMGALGTVHGRRADGTEVPLEASISQATVGGRKVYTAILRDISQPLRAKQELRESVERLRQLSRQLVEAQEMEQRRISTELHDRIGQSLTALGLNLETIATLAPQTGSRVAERLADSRALLQATMAAVRGLIAEIRPVALDDYGLRTGLQALAHEFASRTGTGTVVEGTDPAPRLTPPMELGLYRIAQEALSNVTKHARARHVAIRLRPIGHGVELSVEDDGRGFDPAAPRAGATRHWGLLMMRERAAAVGAALSIDSAPGAGTRVVVRTMAGSAEGGS